MAISVDLSKIETEILTQVLLIGDKAVEGLTGKIADDAQRLAPEGVYPDEPAGSTRKTTKANEKKKAGYEGTIKSNFSVVKSKNVPHSYLAVAGHFTSHFQEYGTAKHSIKAKHAKTLAYIGKSGKLIFRKNVLHPGHEAHSFMEPATQKAEIFLDEVLSEMQNIDF